MTTRRSAAATTVVLMALLLVLTLTWLLLHFADRIKTVVRPSSHAFGR